VRVVKEVEFLSDSMKRKIIFRFKERSLTMKRFLKKGVVIAIMGLAILIFSSCPLFASVTGKISGKVVDIESGEELPGASIQIVGTTLGNMSQADGSYFIISIPPGEYSVKASLIGYQSVTATGVQVVSDHTTEQNFKLRATALELEGITVTAERKAIDKDITSSVRTISTSEIKNMPVKEISQILATQVGFVTKNYELHIRGGRAGEALYIVDGVETRDLLGGLGKVTGGMNVSSANIEEISVLKGGFDAEYGNAQSAVINLVTKEGSSKTTSGNFEFLTDDFGAHKLNKYSFNSDRMEFGLSGPDPFFTSRLLPALGIKFLGEKVAYYISGTLNKTDTYYDVNKYATPITAKKFRVDQVLGFDIPERMNNEYSSLFKITYKAAPDKKLVFSAKGTWDRYSLFFNPTSETRGDINIWQYRYTPSTIPQIESNTQSLSLLFTHNVSKSSFYEVQVSRYFSKYLQRPGDPNTPGGSLDPGKFWDYSRWESFTDVNQDGKWEPAELYSDVNQNGRYDLGEPFKDTNKDKNGQWDPGEPCLYPDENGNCPPGVPFTDLPGAGRWNNSEPFHDTPDSDNPNDKGNGRFDPGKQYQAYGATGVDLAEPYVDGDINLGEPFEDKNGNGVYDKGDVFDAAMDLNGNGRYDGPNDPWTPGVPFEDRNNNGKFDSPNGTWDPGEKYTDLNGNGKWDDVDGFYDRGHERRCYYQDRRSTFVTLKLDFTSQVSKEHQIRTGFSMERDKLEMGDIRYPYYTYDGPPDNGPWPTKGIFRDFYTRRPVRGAYYIQDKIEYGAMVAKLGLRYDWFLQSGDLRGLPSEDTPTEAATIDTRGKLAPRMSVSYPITDKAKIYFNYGHFYQLPELHYMYAQKTQGSSGIKLYGNYNLDYMKQVAYELGVDYVIPPNYKLTVSGFYKDYYSQLNTEQLKIGPSTFEYYANTDYARSRGLEAELNKRYGGYISGYINYQYAFAYGKSSAEVSNYYARAEAGDIPIQEFPLEWDVRHQITLNLDLRVSKDEHPRLFGYKLPDNWGINVVWQYGSGLPFTPGSNYPGLILHLREQPIPYSKRLPATSNVDVRFNKDFQIWRTNYSFQIWVENLFDKRNVLEVYGTTGRPDTDQNLFDEVWNQNVAYLGREIDQNPLDYAQGRNIRLGLSVNF
jgi:outer membrane receptor protein involved in Fe transport